MERRRGFEVELVPKGRGEIRRWRFPPWKTALAALGLLACAGGWVWIALEWDRIPVRAKNPEIEVLERENEALGQALRQAEEAVAEIDTSFRSLIQVQERVTGLTDIPDRGPRTAAGGLPPESGTEALDRAHRLLLAKASTRHYIHSESGLEKLPVVAPFGAPHQISTTFGPHLDPFTGRQAIHEGIDFAGAEGDTVLAPADGTVLRTSSNSSSGLVLSLAHENGLTTVYAHLAKFLVQQGRSVKRGTPIALLGSSGRSSGAHLHYEIRRNGIAIDPGKALLLRDNAPPTRQTDGEKK